MSLDVGGTSADVAFIREGMPRYGVGEMIGEFPHLHPYRRGDLHRRVAVAPSPGWTISACSRWARRARGRARGPPATGAAASAPPSPDAFVALGYIGRFDPDYSAIEIDVDKARAAVGTVAGRIGRSVEETAQAIVDIAVSGMYMEVSKLISRDGVDPREFAMQAFGARGRCSRVSSPGSSAWRTS